MLLVEVDAVFFWHPPDCSSDQLLQSGGWGLVALVGCCLFWHWCTWSFLVFGGYFWCADRTCLRISPWCSECTKIHQSVGTSGDVWERLIGEHMREWGVVRNHCTHYLKLCNWEWVSQVCTFSGLWHWFLTVHSSRQGRCFKFSDTEARSCFCEALPTRNLIPGAKTSHLQAKLKLKFPSSFSPYLQGKLPAEILCSAFEILDVGSPRTLPNETFLWKNVIWKLDAIPSGKCSLCPRVYSFESSHVQSKLWWFFQEVLWVIKMERFGHQRKCLIFQSVYKHAAVQHGVNEINLLGSSSWIYLHTAFASLRNTYIGSTLARREGSEGGPRCRRPCSSPCHQCGHQRLDLCTTNGVLSLTVRTFEMPPSYVLNSVLIISHFQPDWFCRFASQRRHFIDTMLSIHTTHT